MIPIPHSGPRLACLALGLIAITFPLPNQASPITALAFSQDGSRLISHGPRSIEIRDPSHGAVLSRWECSLPKITAIRFDRSGRWLAIAGGTPAEDGETRLLSWPNGIQTARWTVAGDLPTAVDFNPAGDRIVVADALGQAHVWPVPREPGKPPSNSPTHPPIVLSGHAGPIFAVAWSPADDVIATAGADRSLKVWAATDGRLIRTFHHHTEAPNVLAFRPPIAGAAGGPPAVCASGADDRTVRVWQPGIGRMVRIVRQHQGAILALAWLPDGDSFLSAGAEGLVRRIDASSDRVLSEWKLSEDWILSLAIRPDGAMLVAGDASGKLTFQPLISPSR